MFRTDTVGYMTVALAGTVALYACASPQDEPAESSTESASQSAEERTSPEQATVIPAGRELIFIVDETLSTEDVEAGYMFDAHLAQPITASDGSIILPAGAAARGIVMESKESNDSDEPAVLVLRIESVQLNGVMASVSGTVVGAEIDSSAGDTGAETAGKVAIGAAAGAIIGQIIGNDTESTLVGAGAGAVAGAVVALTTRDGHATLPDGSTIVVRLDEPVVAN